MESRKVDPSKIKAKRAQKIKEKAMAPLSKIKKMVSELKMAQTDQMVFAAGRT